MTGIISTDCQGETEKGGTGGARRTEVLMDVGRGWRRADGGEAESCVSAPTNKLASLCIYAEMVSICVSLWFSETTLFSEVETHRGGGGGECLMFQKQTV